MVLCAFLHSDPDRSSAADRIPIPPELLEFPAAPAVCRLVAHLVNRGGVRQAW
jgi:hypothetical protein